MTQPLLDWGIGRTGSAATAQRIIRPLDFDHKKPDPKTWVPHPGFQRAFASSAADECLGGGAAGPGKTDLLLLLWLRFAEKPWMKILLLRRTSGELQEMQDRAEHFYRPFGATFSTLRSRWEFPAGGWIRMGYADRYAMLQRHMGFEYTGVGWDELGQVPAERWWTLICSRIRSTDPEAQRYLWARASANPGGEGHAWVKRRFIGPCDADGSRIFKHPRTGLTRQYCPGTLDDNPSIDPEYERRLAELPEREQKALRYGDWDAAEGLALEELDWEVHGRPRLTIVPDNWWQFGSHDWGFTHYAVTVWFGVDEVGILHVIDAVWSRRVLPAQIAEEVNEVIPTANLATIWCSPDCWNTDSSRSDSNPVIADKYAEAGWPLQKANTDRVQRLASARDLVSYRARGQNSADVTPGVVFHDTPAVRRIFNQLLDMVTDPDRPDTVSKVDLPTGQTEGGDDGWDSFSFGVASYTQPSKPKDTKPLHAFDRAALAAMADKQARHTSKIDAEEDGLIEGERDGPPILETDGLWEVL